MFIHNQHLILVFASVDLIQIHSYDYIYPFVVFTLHDFSGLSLLIYLNIYHLLYSTTREYSAMCL